MKKEVQDLWVAALRSGDYEQGKHALRYGDAFCCLGVLCDLMPNHPDWIDYTAKDGAPGIGYFEMAGESGLLPRAVQNWAGMKTIGGLVDTSAPALEGSFGVSRSLVDANDIGASFQDIADWIEKNGKVL